jgi:predicted ATPase
MGGRVASPTFVGRVEELGVLEAARRRAANGEPAVVLAELDRSGRAERMELLRLSRAETAAQLVGILHTAPPPDLVDAVFARSQGNPFFTEELLTAQRAGSPELPATVRDLLRGRVQRLPAPAQQVLRVVALAGRRVPHRLLAAVAGLDQQTLEEALRAGVTDRLLVARPGQDGYDVRHALLREVLDADLLPDELARLHASFAQVLARWPKLTGFAEYGDGWS